MAPQIWKYRNLIKGVVMSDFMFVCVCTFIQKHPAPEDWLYKEARGLFLKPEVVDCSAVELKWSEPDEDGLIQYMCNEKQFR